MKLHDWLKSVDKSRGCFAAEIGVEEVTVGRYITGVRRPRWDILAKIMKVTDGKVGPEDFMHPLPRPSKSRKRKPEHRPHA
jgi:hypothetical protein